MIPENDFKKIIFVYGTLKREEGNNYLLEDSEFIGEHTTDPVYNLLDGGFPIVTRGGNTAVKGELFLITDPLVANRIDRLEGHFYQGCPENWYDTDTISTKAGDAFIYVMENKINTERKKIENGIWKSK